MGAIGYLYRRTLINNVKRALRKPVTYVYIAIIAFYLFFIPFGLGDMVTELGMASAGGMASVLTLFAFWLIPGNLIAYTKRRGLAYKNSDVHFLFASPTSPKRVLMYAYIKTLPVLILLNIFVTFCGAMLFDVPVWKLIIYFLFSFGAENILECSVMLLLYGTERLNEKQRKWIVWAAYGLMGIFVVIGFCMYLREGLSMQTVSHFLHSDAVQLVPVAGWYIAVLHLIFMGATTVNVLGTVLYICLFVMVVIAAFKMKCTGAFYEDAIKFAEDYEEALQKQKQGSAVMVIGKKKKFGKASVRWKGTGAKALFYRQLLEYKKSRFFIFDFTTLLSLVVGIGIPWLYLREGGFDEVTPYIIPLVGAYLLFMFSTINGKWAKELKSPYTYLIPAEPFSKLVNATAMQNIHGLINGILLTIPGAIVMKLSPWTAILCIVAYAALAANKLYALAVAEIVVGNVLGLFGKQMLQLFLQGIAIGIAVLGAVLGHMLGGVEISYLFMCLFLLVFDLVYMIIASLNFDKMETA